MARRCTTRLQRVPRRRVHRIAGNTSMGSMATNRRGGSRVQEFRGRLSRTWRCTLRRRTADACNQQANRSEPTRQCPRDMSIDDRT